LHTQCGKQYLVNGTQFETEMSFSSTPGSVLIGFADGMVGMKVGGTRLIVVPAHLGYGTSIQHTPTVTIPPNSTLVFRVKLNSFVG
jgi:FKBP-type peptidyl-prolyl cis-trans isomerase FkpA